jgi:predicted Fe-Mo cluster-binding NifX family protein
MIQEDNKMRICIPTETNEGKAATVYGHFGSAPYFTIYDINNDTIDIIDNTTAHHAHGTCQPLRALAGKHVDAVVTGGMGARAVMMLNEGGIKTYRAIAGSVADVIKHYKEGQLEEITVNNACASHGCH